MHLYERFVDKIFKAVLEADYSRYSIITGAGHV